MPPWLCWDREKGAEAPGESPGWAGTAPGAPSGSKALTEFHKCSMALENNSYGLYHLFTQHFPGFMSP